MTVLLTLILLVTLASPFGDASAGAVDLDGGMTIEVVVEVDRTFEIVLARPFSSFEELPPTALSDLGNGSWGGFVVLPSAENWNIVFDAFEPDGTTFRSDTTDMLALGVDKAVIEGEPAGPVRTGRSVSSTWWLIAAVVLILAALGALTWWTFGGEPGDDAPAAGEGDGRDVGGGEGTSSGGEDTSG